MNKGNISIIQYFLEKLIFTFNCKGAKITLGREDVLESNMFTHKPKTYLFNKLKIYVTALNEAPSIEIISGACDVCKEHFEPMQGRHFGGWQLQFNSEIYTFCGTCMDIISVAAGQYYRVDKYKKI